MAAMGEAQAFVSRAFRYNSDECLIWPYACRETKGIRSPCFGHGGKIVSVRRHLMDRFKSDVAPTEFIIMSCENNLCVNRKHFIVASRKDIAQKMIAKGKFVLAPRQSGNINWQSVTPEIAQMIFEAKGIQREIGQRFGVTQSCVSLIKRGKHWSQKNKA